MRTSPRLTRHAPGGGSCTSHPEQLLAVVGFHLKTCIKWFPWSGSSVVVRLSEGTEEREDFNPTAIGDAMARVKVCKKVIQNIHGLTVITINENGQKVRTGYFGINSIGGIGKKPVADVDFYGTNHSRDRVKQTASASLKKAIEMSL